MPILPKVVADILIQDEVVSDIAVQRRVYALLHRRNAIATTNNRLIIVVRKLFGGFQQRTIRWQDMKAVNISTGPISASISVEAFASPDLATSQATFRSYISGLGKPQAQAVYRTCQAQEQAWRERRRIRELEEMRAKSGGWSGGQGGGGFDYSSAPMPGASQGAVQSATPSQDDPVANLAKVKAMLDQGLIEDAEYHAIKAQILSRL